MKEERSLGRQVRERAANERAEVGEARGCLFCRESDGGFKSQEHVIPESLGNTEIVLPNGVVCDRCNSGVLSELDQALCDFLPIKMRRTMLGVRSKAGKIPEVRFSTGTLQNTGEQALRIALNNPTDSKTFREKSRVGRQVELGLKVSGGSRITPRYCSILSRAMLKSMLECAWIDHGEMMLESRFDHVREAVLGTEREGFLILARRGDPEYVSVQLTYDFAEDSEGADRMWIMGNYFGTYLATDSRLPTPVEEVPDEHAMLVLFGPG